MNVSNFVWTEKYRPHSISDCILPKALKAQLLGFVEAKQIPNVMFFGPAGVGKTSAAMALCEDIGAEYLFIQGALEGNIDTLRTKIKDFATTVSLVSDVKKYVIIDEGDRMSAQMMDALKSFIEEYSINCGFIITSNHINKMIPPLVSRCPGISFVFPAAEKQTLVTEQFTKALSILKKENVTNIDKSFTANLVFRNYPDFRKSINELHHQALSLSGEHTTLEEKTDISKLIGFLKARDYGKIREWVAHNATNPQAILSEFYQNAESLAKKESIPALVILLGEYQYKQNFVLDQQINLAAFFAQAMIEVEWK